MRSSEQPIAVPSQQRQQRSKNSSSLHKKNLLWRSLFLNLTAAELDSRALNPLGGVILRNALSRILNNAGNHFKLKRKVYFFSV